MINQAITTDIHKQSTDNKSIELCPICSSVGSIYLRDCRDYIYGLSGSWEYRRCEQCKSLWLSPQPAREMIPQLYPESYYTHAEPVSPLAEPSDLRSRLRFAAKLNVIAAKYGYCTIAQHSSLPLGNVLGYFIGLLPGIASRAGYTIRFVPHRFQGHLLDVGAGNGGYMQLMQQLGWQVSGIEPDPHAAQSALESGLDVQQATIEDVALEPEAYDTIVLYHVTEHLLDPKAVLQKLVHSLKPGGRLVSISPNPIGMVANLFKNQWCALDPPRHLVLPSPTGYQSMFDLPSLSIQVFTSMLAAGWIFKESMSIKKTGHIGNTHMGIVPRVVSTLGTALMPIIPTLGEDVICIVEKKL